jgi:hypothetical protein
MSDCQCTSTFCTHGDIKQLKAERDKLREQRDAAYECLKHIADGDWNKKSRVPEVKMSAYARNFLESK